MAQLLRCEMETIVNYNAGEEIATVYTADKAVMRKLDKLVDEFPEQYQMIRKDSLSKTYSMPKTYVTYRKPRKLTDEQREQKREIMMILNETNNNHK